MRRFFGSSLARWLLTLLGTVLLALLVWYFGPLLSFEVTPDAADKVVASSRLILPATSFGGVESTWERRARWPAETAPAGLIRLSVGVEPAADLITDIDNALEVL